MADLYAPQTWVDGIGGGTPVDADRLNHMEAGIDAVDAALAALIFRVGPYSVGGTLAVSAGTLRIPITRSMTATKARVMVAAAPTGSSLIVDVNKNGTTLFSTQGNRPTVAIGANDSGAGTTPDITSLLAGDYVTFDIDQVGSTFPGADLVVVLEGLYT